MKRLILGAAMIVATPANAVPVFGVALQTCGRWTATKDDQADRLTQMSWLGGFMSGYNLSAQANRTGSIDVYAGLAWMDQCYEVKPLQNVATAALQLMAELNAK